MKMTVDSSVPVTLQSFLHGRKGFSKRLLTRLKRTDMGITRNGSIVRSIDIVYPGDEIVIRTEDTSLLEPNHDLKAAVIFENENLVVFDKPPGMPVHPSVRHQGDTLGNLFAAMYPDTTFRPVNRLDRDTSGLCIIAKNAHAANVLQGECKKVYYAAVHGLVDESGTIDAPIARRTESIILRCIRDDGQPSVTHYRRIAANSRYSLAEIELETGRTHQIRVHFSYIGHPLAGDDLYGGLRDDIHRQALHCGRLTFTEPLSGLPVTVKSQIPNEIRALFPGEAVCHSSR
ncbi:MAG: RluA family pseudouridine synthase [Ruminococcus sp.]